MKVKEENKNMGELFDRLPSYYKGIEDVQSELVKRMIETLSSEEIKNNMALFEKSKTKHYSEETLEQLRLISPIKTKTIDAEIAYNLDFSFLISSSATNVIF